MVAQQELYPHVSGAVMNGSKKSLTICLWHLLGNEDMEVVCCDGTPSYRRSRHVEDGWVLLTDVYIKISRFGMPRSRVARGYYL